MLSAQSPAVTRPTVSCRDAFVTYIRSPIFHPRQTLTYMKPAAAATLISSTPLLFLWNNKCLEELYSVQMLFSLHSLSCRTSPVMLTGNHHSGGPTGQVP